MKRLVIFATLGLTAWLSGCSEGPEAICKAPGTVKQIEDMLNAEMVDAQQTIKEQTTLEGGVALENLFEYVSLPIMHLTQVTAMSLSEDGKTAKCSAELKGEFAKGLSRDYTIGYTVEVSPDPKASSEPPVVTIIEETHLALGEKLGKDIHEVSAESHELAEAQAELLYREKIGKRYAEKGFPDADTYIQYDAIKRQQDDLQLELDTLLKKKEAVEKDIEITTPIIDQTSTVYFARKAEAEEIFKRIESGNSRHVNSDSLYIEKGEFGYFDSVFAADKVPGIKVTVINTGHQRLYEAYFDADLFLNKKTTPVVSSRFYSEHQKDKLRIYFGKKGILPDAKVTKVIDLSFGGDKWLTDAIRNAKSRQVTLTVAELKGDFSKVLNERAMNPIDGLKQAESTMKETQDRYNTLNGKLALLLKDEKVIKSKMAANEKEIKKLEAKKVTP